MKEIQRIKQMLIQKIKELEKLKMKTEKSLKKAPEGTLVLSDSHGVAQYFYKEDPTQKRGSYICKKNKKLITALAQKDYDLALYKEIEKQEKQIGRILKILPEHEITDIFENLPKARKTLVNPHVITDEQYIEQWLDLPYTGNPFPGEFPKLATERGEKVRSKTEKMLADKLYSLKIPYRYEYPLYLKDFGTVYPDFTLLKIDTREEIYLEHFGMMNDEDYSEKAILKLQAYARNKIYPGKNLLLTFETKNTPLDMVWAEQMLIDLLGQNSPSSNLHQQ